MHSVAGSNSSNSSNNNNNSSSNADYVCRAAQRGGGSFHAGRLRGDSCNIVIAAGGQNGGSHTLSYSKYQVRIYRCSNRSKQYR